MQIRTIWNGFKAFEWKFESLEQYSMRSNTKSNHCKRIEALQSTFEAFKRDLKHSNANFIDSKGIRSIQLQVLSIQKGFEAFESKFEPFKWDSKHSNANSIHLKGILSIALQIQTIRKDSKHSNANSNHSKDIRSIRMQIRTIRNSFEAFECKF